MSRYIDKDILFEIIEGLTWYHPVQGGEMVEGANTNGWYKSEDIYKAIDDLTSADAVKVVRCKDCKWWTKQEDSLQGRCALMRRR